MENFFIKNITFQPAIKWSGSKRSQCNEIIKHFPLDIDTYFEPFCGGCSMLYRLMAEPSMKVNKYVVSDLNADLIKFWIKLKNNRQSLIKGYKELWNEFNIDNNQDRMREYYFKIRDRYNKNHDTIDFLFLMRTCYNGSPRYNSKGEFNTCIHPNRKGIEPQRLEKIFEDWSYYLNFRDVEFLNISYDEIEPTEKDFCYFDPPYEFTRGLYFCGFDNGKFIEFLKTLKCNWIMSYDGRVDSDIITKDNSNNVPKELYTEKILLRAGNSSFRRLTGNLKNTIHEALYIKN